MDGYNEEEGAAPEGKGVTRRDFMFGLAAAGLWATVPGRVANVFAGEKPEEKAKEEPSFLDQLPGKKETFTHPSGKLKVEFVVLTEEYQIPEGPKLPKGLVAAEIEQEGMRSNPFPLGKDNQGFMSVLRNAINDTPNDQNAVPLTLVRYRIIRPEHLEILNDPEKNDVLTPQGVNSLYDLKASFHEAAKKDGKGAKTDVKIEGKNDLTADNCIYAVWEGVPLVEGLNKDSQNGIDMGEVINLAEKYGADYNQLYLILAEAKTLMVEAQGNFYHQNALDILASKP